MSRRLLAFLLSDLDTVRILCRRPGCGGVTEMPVANVAARFADPRCPVCQAELLPGNAAGTNALTQLARAVTALQAHADKVGVEFVLPDPAP